MSSLRQHKRPPDLYALAPVQFLPVGKSRRLARLPRAPPRGSMFFLFVPAFGFLSCLWIVSRFSTRLKERLYRGLGWVDLPSRLSRPLLRTGLAKLLHPAPDRSVFPTHIQCARTSDTDSFIPGQQPVLLLSISTLIRWPMLLNTSCRSCADNSPMRSSFVNHDILSLCTVIVSLSRSIYLPALRSTGITLLQHYYG